MMNPKPQWLVADPCTSCLAQVLASLRVEQGLPEEALAALRASVAMWTPSLVPATKPSSDSRSATSLNAEPATPSFEFRFEAAKLLLELDDTTTAAEQVTLL